MDKQAFKQRMQNLKSYRENNPGKGYWDWRNSLPALGILPFIPSGLQKAKKAIKQIPTVNKNTQSLLDAKFSQLEKLDQAKSNYANEQYRIIERVMEDPSYTNRANEVRKQFGKELKFYEEYKTAYGDIYPNTQEWPTDKQYRILKKFSNNQYFTDKEKNFIINYLIDCLVEGQPFDCSSLGPNKYLNE